MKLRCETVKVLSPYTYKRPGDNFRRAFYRPLHHLFFVPDIAWVMEFLFLRILKLADKLKEVLRFATGDGAGHTVIKDYRTRVEVDLLHHVRINKVTLMDTVKARVLFCDLA